MSLGGLLTLTVRAAANAETELAEIGDDLVRPLGPSGAWTSGRHDHQARKRGPGERRTRDGRSERHGGGSGSSFRART